MPSLSLHKICYSPQFLKLTINKIVPFTIYVYWRSLLLFYLSIKFYIFEYLSLSLSPSHWWRFNLFCFCELTCCNTSVCGIRFPVVHTALTHRVFVVSSSSFALWLARLFVVTSRRRHYLLPSSSLLSGVINSGQTGRQAVSQPSK